MYPELELVLTKKGRAKYVASFRLRSPDDANEPRWETAPFRIDPEFFESDALLSDSLEYGARLGRALFRDAQAQTAWKQAEAASNRVDEAFRFRVSTDQAATELHRLRWELLRVPSFTEFEDSRKANWVVASNRVFFSRHLYSSDMRPVRLRAHAELSTLVVIASPPALTEAEGNLSPLDLDEEWKIAQLGLAPAIPRQLISDQTRIPPAGKETTRVTLPRLLEALRAQPDILYLVCHGTVDRDEPLLLLENDAGDCELVSGDDLIEAFSDFRTLPRLVVLVSCQSAGAAGSVAANAARQAAVAALGPKLAEAGVAAVLGMQGDFSHATARRFLPEFFRVLKETGQVDQALAIARTAVKDADDAWMPVLYTRLVEGRVWYVPGLRTKTIAADIAWEQLCIDIESERCLPILGSGLLEPFMGSTLELAYNLAKEHGCPLSRTARDDLPQISQFLQTMGGNRVQTKILEAMQAAILRRFPQPQVTGVRLERRSPGLNVEKLLKEAWDLYRADHPFEPHVYLAGHPKLKTFMTMNPDNLMETALQTIRNEKPCSYYFRWAKDTEVRTGGDKNSADTVYHLAGRLDDDRTLLTTEDDYFRFLASTSRLAGQHRSASSDQDQIVSNMLGSIAKSDLLFLGFRHTDWDFRTLCKLLTSSEDGSFTGRVHVAVQVNPEEGTAEDAMRTREYVSRLFNQLVGTPLKASVGMYWGSTEDFLKELDVKWKS